MMRARWWVAIGLAAVALAGFGHHSASSSPLGLAPGLTLPQLPQVHATPQVTLQALEMDGAGTDTSAVVGNGGSVVLQASYAVRSASETPRIAVRLERRLGSEAWTATGIEAVTTVGQPLSVRTPAYSTSRVAQTVRYRLASDSSASAPISVVYENQQRYTGMAATMYRYAAPYCPHTAVHVATLNGREAGEYLPGTLLIRIDSKVGVSVNMEPVNQRAVALHECSHELQWLNYGGTSSGYDQMKTAAATYFTEDSNGAAPLEHAADCGAKALNPEGYLGYGGYCTPSELEVASRLFAGQRY